MDLVFSISILYFPGAKQRKTALFCFKTVVKINTRKLVWYSDINVVMLL